MLSIVVEFTSWKNEYEIHLALQILRVYLSHSAEYYKKASETYKEKYLEHKAKAIETEERVKNELCAKHHALTNSLYDRISASYMEGRRAGREEVLAALDEDEQSAAETEAVNQKLREEVNDLNAELAAIKLACEAQTNEVLRLQNENERVKADLEVARNCVNAEDLKASLKDKDKKIDELDQLLREACDTHEETLNQIESLETMVANLQNEIATVTERLEDREVNKNLTVFPHPQHPVTNHSKEI
jgi:chromosome segregation ATPase